MSERPDGAATLRGLLDTYYRAWFRYHPEAAVDVGVPGYELRLTPRDEESAGALVCLNDELLVALDEIDPLALAPDEKLDYALVRGAAALENQKLLDVDPKRVDPQLWLPLNAIYQLTVRPVGNFEDALLARLRAVPEHLQAARDYLVPRMAQMPPAWAKTAAVSARAGVAFLKEIPACPKLTSRPAGLDSAVSAACTALVQFGDFLESAVAPGASASVACGKPHFEHLLREQHGLDVGIDAIRVFGERLFERTREELRVACRELTGRDDLALANERLRANRPEPGKVLEAYRDAMRAARRFLESNHLVTLPIREQLDVVETPVFLRNQIPFAAYLDPSPSDAEQRGLYYVTPPATGAELAEHDHVSLKHTCVHEAWPGHHLQFVTANRNPSACRWPRLLNASATLYEGWALYCEQLMQEQGFLGDAESRYVLLRDRLWRALRVLIDIDLHVQGVSMDEAASRLVNELGFESEQARAEITWYSRAPTVPLGYATGWAMINAAREQWLSANPGSDLAAFHDRLLSVGSVALPRVIEQAFGSAVWAQVRKTVFEG